jgi:hypothetical protein
MVRTSAQRDQKRRSVVQKNLSRRFSDGYTLNHPQFGAPNTTPTNPAFGQVTSTVAAQQRVITVGARLKF